MIWDTQNPCNCYQALSHEQTLLRLKTRLKVLQRGGFSEDLQREIIEESIKIIEEELEESKR